MKEGASGEPGMLVVASPWGVSTVRMGDMMAEEAGRGMRDPNGRDPIGDGDRAGLH